MKKSILSFLLIIISFSYYSQTRETITVYKGTVDAFKYEHSINNGTDTTTYFYFGYQNMKYEHITDIGSILYIQKKDVQALINGIREVCNKNTDGHFRILLPRGYSIICYSFAKDMIYIEDKNGKYTMLSKIKAEKLANEIEQNINILKK